MIFNWIKSKIIGSKNAREINRLKPFINLINQKEIEYQKLSDEELKNKTLEFKERIKNGATIDDLKVEAYAAVKNTCRRLCKQKWNVCGYEIEWNMVPFDVQLIGALALHEGKIAEMATGEGKTLVASMPLYLNALSGENVQLVTVNEYLAQRDSEWMGKVYEFLGLTVGYITNDMSHYEKKEIYQRDIVYGTASEFGFDYLRDNGMAVSSEQQVQRSHYYCIIDEVDSILIDEARTPLIISGAVDVSTHKYDKLKPRVAELVRKQSMICTDLIALAEKKLTENPDDEEACVALYKVSIGTPKNRKFTKMMENPKFKRILESTETILNSDMKKENLQFIKEELCFVIDEKSHQVNITERGREFISYKDDPDEFLVPDIVTFYQELDERTDIDDLTKKEKKDTFQRLYEEKMEKIHNVSQLLKAYSLFEKDIEYVVQENKVMIVDEFTGRLQPGRRFSDGLHQALEAKEGVKIEKETQTLATVTIQNYFRLYKKLSGMTGTAETEADEFYQIYKMDVIVIPTNVKCTRADKNDIIYKTKREKYNAIIDDVEAKNKEGRPVLVGTVNVEVSELLSRLMKRRKIPHNVLNAKQNQKEAEIVADAGLKGKVTIATNMAGRGTDIKLGIGVKDLSGLHIIGSERHESRRIDRQLRGRAGRQGDPGSSVFFVSLEDDLMRLFGSDRIVNVMEKLGMEEGQELESPFLTKAIERAQKKVEERNFSIRKHTLEFDDVMNKQRSILYQNRNMILNSTSLKSFILDRIDKVIENNVYGICEDAKEIDSNAIISWFSGLWPMFPKPKIVDLKTADKIIEEIKKNVHAFYDKKERFEGEENIRQMERFICLDVIDRLWKEHLRIMDEVRESSYLMAYGQKDPLQEYKKGAFEAFADFMERADLEISSEIFRLTSVIPREVSEVHAKDLSYMHEIIENYSGKNPQDIITNKEGGEG
ncbi:MAG: hypothetical protein ACD_79C00451G0004, partial [uncultured bacterium]